MPDPRDPNQPLPGENPASDPRDTGVDRRDPADPSQTASIDDDDEELDDEELDDEDDPDNPDAAKTIEEIRRRRGETPSGQKK